MNIGFRLELDPQYWSDSYGIQETDKEKLSALLHEYIHYLQDTCTYYGALHRGVYQGGYRTMTQIWSGIRHFCVFLFWPQKTDKNRYCD